MGRVVAVLAILVVGASAFTPSVLRQAQPQRHGVAMDAARREVMGQAAAVLGLAFSGAGAALADGAQSEATVRRARGRLGTRIKALEGAVAKGDIQAVKDERPSFDLFISGVYPTYGAQPSRAMVENRAKAEEALAKLWVEVDEGDKAGVQETYKAFCDVVKLSAADDLTKTITSDYGQGASSEFSFRARTPKGTFYIR